VEAAMQASCIGGMHPISIVHENGEQTTTKFFLKDKDKKFDQHHQPTMRNGPVPYCFKILSQYYNVSKPQR
jgi:hypothetical protein